MVKFVLSSKKGRGPKTYGIGLTKTDISWLRKGKPIHFMLGDLLGDEGFELERSDEVLIFRSCDEELVVKELEKKPWNLKRVIYRDYRD